MNDRVTLTVAPTGPLASRHDHPGLPLSPTEIGTAVAEACEAGAAIAHIHARDEEGLPTADPAVYAAIIAEIEARCDIVIQVSTGVGLAVSVDDRLEIARDARVAAPLATLNPASMTFAGGTFHNPPDFVESLARALLERGVQPELEVYDFGHVALCLDLVARGLVREPLQFSFVMGVRGGVPGDPRLLPALVALLPAGSTWQAIGIGRHQLDLSFAALALGGNLRVGFEDNVHLRRGVLAESNAQLVTRAAELVRLSGREPSRPDDVRARLRE